MIGRVLLIGAAGLVLGAAGKKLMADNKNRNHLASRASGWLPHGRRKSGYFSNHGYMNNWLHR